MHRICGTAALVASMAVTGAAQAELGAFWNFNNTDNVNPITGAPTSSFFHQVGVNTPFDDGRWDNSNDLLLPVFDGFNNDPGVLIDDAQIDASDPGFNYAGAHLDVSNLTGDNGVSNTSQNNNWLSFQGTTVNGTAGPDPTPFAGGSLAITGSGNNNSYFDVVVTDPTYQIDSISWAQRGTSTGFNLREILVSTDGGATFSLYAQEIGTLSSNWTAEEIDFVNGGSPTGYNSLNTPLAGVDVVRFQLSGASSSNGNNRFDNIAIDVSVIPEPATMILLAAGGALMLVKRRRRTA